jgi:hypothetical protein
MTTNDDYDGPVGEHPPLPWRLRQTADTSLLHHMLTAPNPIFPVVPPTPGDEVMARRRELGIPTFDEASPPWTGRAASSADYDAERGWTTPRPAMSAHTVLLLLSLAAFGAIAAWIILAATP